jgi:hypothetical protein
LTSFKATVITTGWDRACISGKATQFALGNGQRPRQSGKPLPQNLDVAGDVSQDKLLRNLDCAVIRYLHDSIEQELSSGGAHGALERFDSVRGLFREGDPIYPRSGFYERTHTQIAVRSLECIKGVFIPRL